MERVLMLASVASMIEQFNMHNIELLIELDYQVDVACNFVTGNTCDQKTIIRMKEKLSEKGVRCFQIDFARKITRFSQHFEAYRTLCKLLTENHYCFIHCHSPIGGIIGRIAGYKKKTKVIYTAHGFHFYKGAPLRNWIIYYPVEWLCSFITYTLITINKEDYCFARKNLHSKKVEYIPGVGIDMERSDVEKSKKCRIEKRQELGIEADRKVLLSVGELNKNKNHEAVITALAKIREKRFVYLICGQGELNEYLQGLIKHYCLEDKVKLLGYRNDIAQMYQAADIFIFPSKREGLSVALMEAMANNLPVICAKIRGNTELIYEGEGGYLITDLSDADTFSIKISRLLGDKKFIENAGKKNYEMVKKYDIKYVSRRMRLIYLSCKKIYFTNR